MTSLAKKINIPFKADIVQSWSTLSVEHLIKTVGFYFLSYSFIVSPNLLTQIQTLAAMEVLMIDRFEWLGLV